MDKAKLVRLRMLGGDALLSTVHKLALQFLPVGVSQREFNARFREDLYLDEAAILNIIVTIERYYGRAVWNTDLDDINSLGDMIEYMFERGWVDEQGRSSENTDPWVEVPAEADPGRF
jgi:acyl carrier protein